MAEAQQQRHSVAAATAIAGGNRAPFLWSALFRPKPPPRPPPQGKREIGQKRTRSAYSQTTFPSSSAASEQPSPTQYFYSPRGGPPGPPMPAYQLPSSTPFPSLASPASSPTTYKELGRGKGGRSLDLRPQLTQHKRSAPLPRFSFPPFMPLGKGVGKRRPPYRPNKLLLISLS